MPMVLCVGCKDDEAAKAIDRFRAATGALAAAYETFVANANTVEEENYINKIVATPAAFDLNAMQAADLMTPEEVAVRGAAVKALGEYLAAVAKLEAGGSAVQIETDAATAGKSLTTLSKDADSAVAKHTGKALVDVSGPASAAVSAMGSVLKLVLEHHGRAEVKKSILDNDAPVQALLEVIAKESKLLYARQRAAAGEQRNAIVGAFDTEAQRAGSGATPGLVDLGEKLKAMPRSMALVAQADPNDAMEALQKTHTSLIKVLQEGGHDKTSLRALLADSESFSSMIGPLVTRVQALAASF